MLAERPGLRGVDQVADPGAGQRDGAGGAELAGEAQLGGVNAAQRDLVVTLQVELAGDQACLLYT